MKINVQNAEISSDLNSQKFEQLCIRDIWQWTISLNILVWILLKLGRLAWRRQLGIIQFSLYIPFTDWFSWPTIFPGPHFSPPPPAFSFSCLVTDSTHRIFFVNVWRMPNRITPGLLLGPWVGPKRQMWVKLGAGKGRPG